MILFALALATQPMLHPIDAAAEGLFAVIEDDVNPDTRLIRIDTVGCTSEIVAEGRRWTVDWNAVEQVGMGDPSFVYIGAPVKIAIITDAEKRENLKRIAEMAEAMALLNAECRAR